MSPSLPLFALVLAAAGAATAADSPAHVDYLTQVKPLLVQHCASCHGAVNQKSGLRLDAAPLIRKGGKHGAVVVAGQAARSRLIQAVTGDAGVERMPQEAAPLSAEQVAMLKAWIDAGAAMPDDDPIPAGPEAHWSFKPPVRPAVPSVANASWVRNPIDAFIADQHEKRNLHPRPEADRATLLRRVYVDLIGLPPTPEQLRAFLADTSGNAYEKVVDQLLASPLYGQRWARHWMDVWRYSDWIGYQQEVRESQPFVWRWRDWIVESLNADKPYDRMVREMLAADELAPGDRDAARATGYLVRSYYKFNRHVWMDNTVEHAGKAFLALTFNCAKCHDHKYDPISQADYYRFRAVFEPVGVRTDPVPGVLDTKLDGLVRVFDETADAKTFLLIRGDEKFPDEKHPMSPGVPKAFGELAKSEPVSLPADAWYPALLPFAREDALNAAESEVAKALKVVASLPAREATETELEPAPRDTLPADLARARLASAEASLTSLRARTDAEVAKGAGKPDESLATAAAAADRRAAALRAEAESLDAELTLETAIAKAAGTPADAKLKQAVADARKQVDAARKAKTDLAARAKPDAADYAPLGPTYPKTSTGRRLALANWITSRDNPLAARVAVNHLWMRHFGKPLVATEFDFGMNGRPPSHPALLDWLAVELMDHGWSTKHLHRLIVTSATYRMDSAADDALAKLDPDNTYLWHVNVRRMEAEAVRDALLHVAGLLDVAPGGPDIDAQSALTTTRRTLYYRHAAEKQSVFLAAFDGPNPVECYRRAETVVPHQALALANSRVSRDASRKLAAALSGRHAADEAFLAAAFEHLLCRPPTEAERGACATFLDAQLKLLGSPKALSKFDGADEAGVEPSADPRQRVREDLVHVLMNHNDFVTVR